jgi:hypothetical protein
MAKIDLVVLQIPTEIETSAMQISLSNTLELGNSACTSAKRKFDGRRATGT